MGTSAGVILVHGQQNIAIDGVKQWSSVGALKIVLDARNLKVEADGTVVKKPKRGRPPKYATEEERLASRRAQWQASQAKGRKQESGK